MEINSWGRRPSSSQNRNGGESDEKKGERSQRVGVDYTSSGFLKMKRWV